MTTGPVSNNPQVNDTYQTGAGDDVSQVGTPPPGSGDIGDGKVHVTHHQQQGAGAPPPPGHDLEHPAGPVTASQSEALRDLFTMDLEPSLDFVSLMGDLVDKLKHSLTDEKTMYHDSSMRLRMDKQDFSYKAADDEENLGDAAMAWSCIQGGAQILVGTTSAAAAAKAPDSYSAQTQSQMVQQIGGGLTAPLGGAEKLVEGHIKARQERAQADAQMAGDLEQDMSPQDVKDTIKDLLQHYGHVADKADQTRETIIGSFRH